MNKYLLLPLVFLLSGSAALAQVNITFELNAATLSAVDPGGLYIAGGTGFGSPGDNQLTDPDSDGIYTLTLQRDAGFSSFYTFTNGLCPDYSCKENISGLPCSDPANFNDRFLPPVTQDTTIKACFGTCDSDGTCTIVTDSIDITFELNTETIATIDPTGIYLAGGGNFGTPGDNPMIDPDSDGIYTLTVRKPMGFASYYTFTNGACGDWSCKEDLAGLPCADPNSFNDRFLPPTMSDTTIKACFGNCVANGSCLATSIRSRGVAPSLFVVQPSPADQFTQVIFGTQAISMEKEIQVISLTGQLMETAHTAHQATYRLHTARYPAGLYYLQVTAGDLTFTRKISVLH